MEIDEIETLFFSLSLSIVGSAVNGTNWNKSMTRSSCILFIKYFPLVEQNQGDRISTVCVPFHSIETDRIESKKSAEKYGENAVVSLVCVCVLENGLRDATKSAHAHVCLFLDWICHYF